MYRHDVLEEYAQQLATSPRRRSRAFSFDEDGRDGLVSSTNLPSTRSRYPIVRATVADTAPSWIDALSPPLEDVQVFVRHLQSDPDLSQRNIFWFLSWLWISIMIVAITALKPREYLDHLFGESLSYQIAIFLGTMLGGLLAIRAVIWCIAQGADVISRLDETGDEYKLPTAQTLLFGGLGNVLVH